MCASSYYFLRHLFYLADCIYGQVSTQEELDDIARNLRIEVHVVDNLQFNGRKHLFRIMFENKGSHSLSGLNWKIFFYSFFIIEEEHVLSLDGNSILPGGYILNESKLRIDHAKGSLYSLTPVEDFLEIKPNTTREIRFFGSNWAISTSDIPPNWYITVDGLSPRVFESTSGDFVGNFDEPNQWKRTKSDLYNPYTPLDRFEKYKDMRKTPKKKIAIPTPKSVIHYDASETLDMHGDVNIVHNGFTNEATYLANKTTFKPVNSVVTEGYTLEIDPLSKTISITAKTNNGIFYGVQTLLSILADGYKIPKLLIEDEPRYEFRGMHVDIARNFRPKSTLLKLLDAMATYKLNKLHLHATDDEGWRLEIKDLPELTQIGSKRCHSSSENDCLIPQLGSGPDNSTSGSGYLSIQDYQEILKYAKDRHIEVIPEVDMPGHARAAIKAMESRYKRLMKNNQKENAEKFRLFDPSDSSVYLSVQYFGDNALSPCIESTFNFVDKVVKEIKAMHDIVGTPLKIFHFGGDEVAKNAWSNSASCRKLGFNSTKRNEIRTSLKKMFAQRVANITHKHGLNLLGWEDGFSEGNGKPFDRALFPNGDVYSNAWDNVWEWGEARRAYNFANAGYKIVMSHATHLYFDHPYDPDPEERGLYWAPRFTDTFKTFGFMPDKLYENIDVSRMGAKLNRSKICGENDVNCPSLQVPENIIGMQGHLWSETVLTESNFYYMVFPRLLALAERAWHKGLWEDEISKNKRDQKMKDDWGDFTETLGDRELKRLDEMGIEYRISPPGARSVDGRRSSRSVKFNPVDQEMIDYLAENLDISFNVLDNLVDTDKSFLQRISITNIGSTTILPGNWSIFFYHIRAINSLKPLLLPGCGMLLEHIAGSLYKLTPDKSTFINIDPQGQVNCQFHAKYWSVAVTDNMPNWYVWSHGTQAKTIHSTYGEDLSFIGPYDTKNKWKRYPSDRYDPFLPRTRYVMNSDVANLGDASEIVKEGTYVIPTPQYMTTDTTKSVQISALDGWVVLASSDFPKEVVLVSDFYAINISVPNQMSKIIRFIKRDISKFPTSLAKTEAYFLEVKPELHEIRVTVNSPKGAFYAVQTLKRLSVEVAKNSYRVYNIYISDAPRYDYRGMFLDVGRNFHTKEEIKVLLDFMSVYKLNKFQLHLSEDEGWRLEIPGLEELTTVGSNRCHDLKERICTASQLGSGPHKNNSGSGFYTVAEYQEILRYANDRYIQIIPEFDMPGHARAAIVSMKERKRIYDMRKNSSMAEQYLLHDPDDVSEYMSVQWFVDNAVNPCIESTYTFIDHLVTEVKAMHDGIQNLEIFSFGGDETAKGAWEKSPKCREFIANNIGIDSVSDLKEHFARRVGSIAGEKGLDISAWEDGLMHGKTPFDLTQLVPNGRKAYTSAWDNVWEKGGGDRSYRLANVGYKVILALATHLYFDHPYEPDPAERGYYWATRYTDTRKAFGFIPDNIYANADVKRNGEPLTESEICGGNTCYELAKPENIMGMMGLVWSETSRTKDQLHDRYFPRMLAVAERAWHKAKWENISKKNDRMMEINKDWTNFANRLGYRELKHLDNLGIKYRVPLPGAKMSGDTLKTNTAFPGLVVEHSQDNRTWNIGKLDGFSKTFLRTKSADGLRTSRIILVSKTTSAAISEKYSITVFVASCILSFSLL
ncbi:hexosaminidase [Mytilus galloprovincialis]|uniref:beta-N-acetylhexosaminidase n=1 Tax=Mytilus galloprovincialis TaxID=29158 RepID=A0A8B6CC32_MYTGA|nr:hexosaminidase [Mytilus galloprovincialis]